MADINLTGVPQFDKIEVIKTDKHTATFFADDSSFTTIPHNLGFVPIALVYLTDEDETLFDPLPVALATNIDTTNNVVNSQVTLFYAVDSTNLYINCNNALPTTPEVFFRYYLLRIVAK